MLSQTLQNKQFSAEAYGLPALMLRSTLRTGLHDNCSFRDERHRPITFGKVSGEDLRTVRELRKHQMVAGNALLQSTVLGRITFIKRSTDDGNRTSSMNHRCFVRSNIDPFGKPTHNNHALLHQHSGKTACSINAIGTRFP